MILTTKMIRAYRAVHLELLNARCIHFGGLTLKSFSLGSAGTDCLGSGIFHQPSEVSSGGLATLPTISSPAVAPENIDNNLAQYSRTGNGGTRVQCFQG